jgi:hypothetical protein
MQIEEVITAPRSPFQNPVDGYLVTKISALTLVTPLYYSKHVAHKWRAM